MAKKQAAPAPALTAELLALIAERDQILPWLEQAKARELELRAQIAAALFPSPVEGANRLFTEDGYQIYLDHKINRNIDEAAIDAVMAELPEGCPARELGFLIRYKPALVMDGYRALPEDQLRIVQQAITETPGSPKLVIEKVEEESADIPVGSPGATGATDAATARANLGTLGTPIMDKYEAAKNASAGPVTSGAGDAPAQPTKTAAASTTRTARKAKDSGAIKASQVTKRMRDVAEAHAKPKAGKKGKK